MQKLQKMRAQSAEKSMSCHAGKKARKSLTNQTLAEGFCGAKFWTKFPFWRGAVRGEVFREVCGEVFHEVFGLVLLGHSEQRKASAKTSASIPMSLHNKLAKFQGKTSWRGSAGGHSPNQTHPMLANPFSPYSIQKRPKPQICPKFAPAIVLGGSSQGAWNLEKFVKICLKITVFFFSLQFWQIFPNFRPPDWNPPKQLLGQILTNLGFRAFLNAVRGKRVRNPMPNSLISWTSTASSRTQYSTVGTSISDRFHLTSPLLRT